MRRRGRRRPEPGRAVARRRAGPHVKQPGTDGPGRAAPLRRRRPRPRRNSSAARGRARHARLRDERVPAARTTTPRSTERCLERRRQPQRHFDGRCRRRRDAAGRVAAVAGARRTAIAAADGDCLRREAHGGHAAVVRERRVRLLVVRDRLHGLRNRPTAAPCPARVIDVELGSKDRARVGG